MRAKPNEVKLTVTLKLTPRAKTITHYSRKKRIPKGLRKHANGWKGFLDNIRGKRQQTLRRAANRLLKVKITRRRRAAEELQAAKKLTVMQRLLNVVIRQPKEGASA